MIAVAQGRPVTRRERSRAIIQATSPKPNKPTARANKSSPPQAPGGSLDGGSGATVGPAETTVGDGEGVGVLPGVRVAVGVGVSVFVGVAVGSGVKVDDGVSVGVGEAVAVGVRVGVALGTTSSRREVDLYRAASWAVMSRYKLP